MADDELPFRYIPPPDPNLGRRVDLYFILRVLLGRGGMGAAYLAEHEALPHVKCVIKLVLVEMLHHPMIISRYHNEAKALSVLRHDNIVKLHGLGVLDDGQLYLRFEYVEGKSLDRYVADHGGRLPFRKAVNFIFQLCWALQHAHDRGVIHRDLKPDNVMIEVDPQGAHVKERVKILDFGIAKVVASGVDVTGSGIQMGTPTYMAPEQVTNAASVDGRADVFSLAQILYKLVTGKLPWGTPENSVEIYHRQRTQAPAWPPDDVMPREVAEVVHRALSIRPEDRPTAHEFAIELASRVKNGTELLAKVVPNWATSSPPDATTLPRPVEPTPPAARSPLADAPGLGGSGAMPPLNVVSFSPQPVKDNTAHASPRALATPAAPPAAPAAPAPRVALGGPATAPVTPLLPPFVPAAHELPWHPPTPVLAALPTGLASQQFAAEQPPIEPRAQQVEVASEIELAAGTPGPLAYAHAELPAVMVSTTQLSGLAPQAIASGVRPQRAAEPPPFIELPKTSDAKPQSARSARSKLVLLGGAASAIAAVAAFAIVRIGSHVTPADEPRSAAIQSDAAPMRGVAVAKPEAGIAQRMPTQLAHPESPINTKQAEQIAAPAPAPVAAATTPATPAPVPAPTRAAPVATVSVDAGVDAAHVATAPRSARPEVIRASPPASSSANQATDAARPSTPAASPSSPTTPAAPAQRPSAVATGELVISVDPYAVVWLDNRKIGPTPLSIDVRVGQHRLRLVNEDLSIEKSIPVTIIAGKQTRVEETW